MHVTHGHDFKRHGGEKKKKHHFFRPDNRLFTALGQVNHHRRVSRWSKTFMAQTSWKATWMESSEKAETLQKQKTNYGNYKITALVWTHCRPLAAVLRCCTAANCSDEANNTHLSLGDSNNDHERQNTILKSPQSCRKGWISKIYWKKKNH